MFLVEKLPREGAEASDQPTGTEVISLSVITVYQVSPSVRAAAKAFTFACMPRMTYCSGITTLLPIACTSTEAVQQWRVAVIMSNVISF